MIPSFWTDSGIPIESVYTEEHLKKIGFEYGKDLGMPGEWPYTRGIDHEMYRENRWTESIYMGFGLSEDCNDKLRSILKEGKDIGLHIALDLPTQLGLDSDHHISYPEVGRVGVAIDTLHDLEILFEGVDIEKLKFIGTTAFSIGPIMLAMFIALGERMKINPEKYVVNLANDGLKEFVSRGTYIFPPKAALRLATDVIEYCARNLPMWEPIHVHGGSFLDAGATAIQEVGFSLAFILAYIEETIKRGLNVDDFLHNFSLRLYTSMDFFESVAKFRAIRRLWSKLIKERFSAKKERSFRLNLQVSTSGASLTAQQPINNIVRVTLQAMSAVLGGAQRIRCAAMDEALSTPTDEALKTALRTQQIIFYESGVTKTVDPLGGSYYIEILTNKIEEEAKKYLDRIDEMGGIIASIENNFFNMEIDKEAYKYQKSVEDAERIIVGVNEYVEKEDTKIQIVKRDHKVLNRQIEKIQDIRKKRDNEKVKKYLSILKNKAKSPDNLITFILDAIRSYATIGEITETLKEVFGEYNEKLIIYEK